MEGNAFSLARWFNIPADASGPYDDEVREEILSDLYANAKAVGVLEGKTFVQTEKGAAIIEPHADYPEVVVFDYVENRRWRRVSFWMNASSVSDLGEVLRSVPRRPFDELFVGAIAR